MSEFEVWMAALALPAVGAVLWLLGTAISKVKGE